MGGHRQFFQSLRCQCFDDLHIVHMEMLSVLPKQFHRLRFSLNGIDMHRFRQSGDFHRHGSGAAADIIVMDYKPFTPFSDENIDGHILFGMTGKLCRTTIANGKLLMKDRELIGIDEEAENAHILEAAKKLWGALNHREY